MRSQFFFLQLASLSVVLSQIACLAQNSQPVKTDVKSVVDGQNGDLRKSWTEKTGNINRQTKNYPRERLNIMLEILRRTPEEKAWAELQRVVSDPNDYSALPAIG